MMKDTKAALIWITNILKDLQAPFQITGGFAAKLYGCERELADIDIDIPEDYLAKIKPRVAEYLVLDLQQIHTKSWDLLMMTVNYCGQEIDLAGCYNTKIFNKAVGEWQPLVTDLSTSVIKEIYGVKIPVITSEALIAYKKMLAREVDLEDIKQLEVRTNQQ